MLHISGVHAYATTEQSVLWLHLVMKYTTMIGFQMCTWQHTNGKVLNQLLTFIKNKLKKVDLSGLPTEMIQKRCVWLITNVWHSIAPRENI